MTAAPPETKVASGGAFCFPDRFGALLCHVRLMVGYMEFQIIKKTQGLIHHYGPLEGYYFKEENSNEEIL